MEELKFYETACEPTRGKGMLVVVLRRLVRKLLRPMFDRLITILSGMIARLDAIDERFKKPERDIAILQVKAEGLAAHLEGLSKEFREVEPELRARIVQLTSLSSSVAGINVRLDEDEERLHAIQALHWDHVALARRLATIEDLLAASSEHARSAIEGGENQPLIPFPGLEEHPRSRVS